MLEAGEVSDSLWLLWTAGLGAACITVSIVFCVCGCKTSEPKDELTGIEGCVKKRNPEELSQEVNANHIPTVLNDIVISVNNEKKPSTANRSLPDLPIDKNNREISWEPNGDANSDLYATVGMEDRRRKEETETDSRSPSTTYAKVKGEHPYDKLKGTEHPYARVRHSRPPPEESVPSTSHHRDSLEGTPPREPAGPDILAATAIAGHIQASEELPYMTPPTYFSGDSQDSGKGYTSISVREPLATIRAETKASNEQNKRHKEVVDSHYATVSDDSDEMYAAIEDPNHIYTSESETYAQIQPNRSSTEPTAPQPPSVDSLKHRTVATHSRQASSSSGSSSGVINSPKPEKRPANSPLPPPPAKLSTDEIYASSEKLRLSVRNVEDMYAKVNKKKNREPEPNVERNSVESYESSDSVSYKLHANHITDTSRSSTSYQSKTDSSTSPSIRKEQIDTISSSDEDSSLQANYERLGFQTAVSDTDPNYEQLRPQEHEYASIARKKKIVDRSESDVTDGYARVKECEHDLKEGDYATVNKEPGYEQVFGNKEYDDHVDAGYESVHFKQVVDQTHEPTYESLGNEFDDPNYESVNYRNSVPVPIEPPYQLLTECETGMGSHD